MMLTTTFALLAATASPQPSLGVSATVVRPVEIVAPTVEAGEAVIVLRNTEAVEVQTGGGTVDRREAGTTLVQGDGTGPVAITLIY